MNDKKPVKKKTPSKYDDKTIVKASFEDIINAVVKDANSKVPIKKAQ